MTVDEDIEEGWAGVKCKCAGGMVWEIVDVDAEDAGQSILSLRRPDEKEAYGFDVAGHYKPLTWLARELIKAARGEK